MAEEYNNSTTILAKLLFAARAGQYIELIRASVFNYMKNAAPALLYSYHRLMTAPLMVDKSWSVVEWVLH